MLQVDVSHLGAYLRSLSAVGVENEKVVGGAFAAGYMHIDGETVAHSPDGDMVEPEYYNNNKFSPSVALSGCNNGGGGCTGPVVWWPWWWSGVGGGGAEVPVAGALHVLDLYLQSFIAGVEVTTRVIYHELGHPAAHLSEWNDSCRGCDKLLIKKKAKGEVLVESAPRGLATCGQPYWTGQRPAGHHLRGLPGDLGDVG